jgi:hypothetical protein
MQVFSHTMCSVLCLSRPFECLTLPCDLCFLCYNFLLSQFVKAHLTAEQAEPFVAAARARFPAAFIERAPIGLDAADTTADK